MIRGLDTMQHHVQLLQKRQELSSGNLANANTSGYQAASLFQSTLKEAQFHNYQGGPEADRYHEVGGLPFGNQVDTITYSDTRGAIKQTMRPTDFSIQEDAYFTVQRPDGSRVYTRNGNFKLNEQNQYITQENYVVLGQDNQPVTATGSNWRTFQLTQLDAATAQSVGQTYLTSDATTPIQGTVHQGMLEQSNVSLADEMVKMLQNSREYETSQKTINSLNDTLKKATSELARM